MKTSLRKKVSRTMIIIGAVLVVFGVGYEAVNYPWRILLAKLGFSISDELPDPKPLGEIEEVESSQVDTEMPYQGNYLKVRPNIEVTQIGVIKLPKLGVSENIVEGSGPDEMLWGVGHVRGTAMPGQKGNCVLAGHRNYVIMHPFRHLDKMALGDKFTLRTKDMLYTYEVFKIFKIGPKDTWILKPSDEAEYLATLLTCTPVINPTHRLIVWGKLIDSQPYHAE